MVSLFEVHQGKVGRVDIVVNEGQIRPTIRPLAGIEIPARTSFISLQPKGCSALTQSAVTQLRHEKCPHCGSGMYGDGNQKTCSGCGYSTAPY